MTKFWHVTVIGLFFVFMSQAQTINASAPSLMVGLPEYSVELSGTPENPVITNHSGKTIIGYVLKFSDKRGDGPEAPILLLYPRSAALAPEAQGVAAVGVEQHSAGSRPATQSPPVPRSLTPPSLRMGSPTPIVRVALDAVAFSDGQFAGPDNRHNFVRMASDVETFRAVGQQLVAAVDRVQIWQQFSMLVEQHMKMTMEDRRQQTREQLVTQGAVNALVLEKMRFGEESAHELAQKYSSMPALRKETLKSLLTK